MVIHEEEFKLTTTEGKDFASYLDKEPSSLHRHFWGWMKDRGATPAGVSDETGAKMIQMFLITHHTWQASPENRARREAERADRNKTRELSKAEREKAKAVKREQKEAEKAAAAEAKAQREADKQARAAEKEAAAKAKKSEAAAAGDKATGDAGNGEPKRQPPPRKGAKSAAKASSGEAPF